MRWEWSEWNMFIPNLMIVIISLIIPVGSSNPMRMGLAIPSSPLVLHIPQFPE